MSPSPNAALLQGVLGRMTWEGIIVGSDRRIGPAMQVG
jgi:hypothetical protein